MKKRWGRRLLARVERGSPLLREMFLVFITSLQVDTDAVGHYGGSGGVSRSCLLEHTGKPQWINHE